MTSRPNPNLRYRMPDGLPELVRLLRGDRVRRVELHHLLGHHHAVAGLAAALGAEPVSVVHDYARFCPRIALLGAGHRYCGEPDVQGCIACIADRGSLLEDDPAIPELLARSQAELSGAARVIVPTEDTAIRIRRHFPGVAPTIEPLEAETLLPPVPAAPSAQRHVVVVGAIGLEKGFEVLLDCVRDAQARRLPLSFTVVGYTMDDERLMAAGPAFVTGEYRDDDAVRLIRAQRAAIAFLPSLFPETWCYALTRVWQSGLRSVVFDIGAQAQRVRRTGRGHVLPLGLPAAAINQALLRLAFGPAAEQCPVDFRTT